jgi:hypothetical protein
VHEPTLTSPVFDDYHWRTMLSVVNSLKITHPSSDTLVRDEAPLEACLMIACDEVLRFQVQQRCATTLNTCTQEANERMAAEWREWGVGRKNTRKNWLDGGTLIKPHGQSVNKLANELPRVHRPALSTVDDSTAAYSSRRDERQFASKSSVVRLCGVLVITYRPASIWHQRKE